MVSQNVKSNLLIHKWQRVLCVMDYGKAIYLEWNLKDNVQNHG